MKVIARILFKGLVVIVPVGVTLYVLWWLGTSAEKLLAPPLAWLLKRTGGLAYQPGMGVAAGLVVLFLLGLLTYWVLFQRVVALLGRLLRKIPLARSVYDGLQDVMDLATRSKQGGRAGRVVAIELADGCRLLGMLTEDRTDSIPQPLRTGPDCVAVYLPMRYQIGGFTVFVPRERLRPVDMSVEDAMRYALTAAMSRTEEQAAATAPLPADGAERS